MRMVLSKESTSGRASRVQTQEERLFREVGRLQERLLMVRDGVISLFLRLFWRGKETCQGLPGRSYTRPLMDSDDRWACVSGEMNGERGGVSSARPRERELTWLQCGRGRAWESRPFWRGRREWRQLWQRVSSC